MNLRIKNNLVILAFENSHWIYHFFLTKIKREFFLLCSYVIDIFSLVLGFSLSLIIMEQYFLWIEKKFIQLFAPLFFVYSLWLKKMLKKKRIKQKKKNSEWMRTYLKYFFRMKKNWFGLNIFYNVYKMSQSRVIAAFVMYYVCPWVFNWIEQQWQQQLSWSSTIREFFCEWKLLSDKFLRIWIEAGWWINENTIGCSA